MINWNKENINRLGKERDETIARDMGISPTSVMNARKKLKIKRYDIKSMVNDEKIKPHESIIRKNNLKYIMVAKGITRKILAKHINRCRNSVIYYERGSIPPPEIRENICRYLNTTEDIIWPYMLWNKIIYLFLKNNDRKLDGRFTRIYSSTNRPDLTPEIREAIVAECYSPDGGDQKETAEKYNITPGFVSHLKRKWERENLYGQHIGGGK